jgi:hypothetical protein
MSNARLLIVGNGLDDSLKVFAGHS